LGNNFWIVGGGMDYVFRSLILFLFSFSSLVLADTYPGIATTTYQSANGNSYPSLVESCLWYGIACGTHSTSGRSPTEACAYGTNQCNLKGFYNNVQDSNTFVTVTVINTYSCPGGGTVSGSNCINATACILPQVRLPTGLCAANPCSTSQTKQLTNYWASGNMTIYSGGGPTMIDGGCEFKCTSEVVRVSSNTAGYYTKYGSCTSTGKIASQSVGSEASATDALGQSSETVPPKPGCAKGFDKQGLIMEVCVKPDGCGTFNGAEVCTNGPNISDKQGNIINSGAGKNCVSGGGKVTCASDVANATSSISMKMPDGTTKVMNVNSKVVTQDAVTTVANPDGSTTKTKTTTNNVSGDPGTSEVTVTQANGNSTTTKTGSSLSDNSLLSEISGNTAKSECEKSPDSVGCAGFGSSIGTVVESVLTTEVPISNSYTSWGSGSCPSSVSLPHGAIFKFDSMCSGLVTLKPILIAMGFLISMFIVVGGVKE
jgi:hypothetical protein